VSTSQHNTERVVIFVSTGRTATKAMATFFSAIPGVIARHEPPPARVLRILINLYMCGRVDRETMRRALTLSRGRLARRARTSVYVEASPFLRGCLDVLDDVFGKVHVVHIVRNPATYIPSYINHGAFNGLKGLIGNRLPFWMPKPEECSRPPRKTWAQMPLAERVAWRWTLLNQELNRGETLFPNRYYRVRFEDLFDPHGKALMEVSRWLGLAATPRDFEQIQRTRVNASRTRHFPAAADWDDKTRSIVQSYCGELMAMYGYEL